MKFDARKTLEVLESLKQPSGAFIAAPAEDYRSIWIRDHLYMALTYYYLGDYEKLAEGIHIIFDIFHAHRHKLNRVIYPEDLIVGELIHAKYKPEPDASGRKWSEVTSDWGHHQLDTIGLFLHIVADLDHKHIEGVRRDRGDRKIIQLLVFYLLNVQYWRRTDNGIWEECRIRRSSSIGAVGGLAQAVHWFRRGASRITAQGYIAEAYVNGAPNEHAPLGWMHALALIAWIKILEGLQLPKQKVFEIELDEVIQYTK